MTNDAKKIFLERYDTCLLGLLKVNKGLTNINIKCQMYSIKAAANASPTTTTPKTKLKKKNSDNGQNNSPLVTGISSNATTTPVATTSILKFVSKMSNKNIDAKPMNSESSTDKIEIIGSKPPLPMNKIANSPLPVNKATNANNSPLALNKVANSPLTMSKVVNSPLTINKATNSPLQLSKVVGSPIGNQKNGTFNTPNNKPKSQSRKSLLGSPALQTTPQSSPLVHNNTTAEKRGNSLCVFISVRQNAVRTSLDFPVFY